MFSAVSSIPTPNAGEGLSNVVHRKSDLSKTQYYQTQYLSNDTLVDCSSAESTAISDFSVESESALGTVLARVEDKKNKASDISEVSKLTTRPFNKDDSIKPHLLIYSSEFLHACDVCEQRFKTRIGLIRHAGSMHNSEKHFKCGVCNKMFQTKYGMSRHKKIHDTPGLYYCHKCERGFASSCCLKRHMRSHNEDKHFKCKICSKIFNRNDTLTRHLLIHSDEHPCACKSCNHGFRTRTALMRHIRSMHSDEKTIHCLDCGRLLKTKKSLYLHIKRCHNTTENSIGLTTINKHIEKQNAGGSSVVNQSPLMVEQSSTSGTPVGKARAQKEYSELLELFQQFDDLSNIPLGAPFMESDEFYNDSFSEKEMPEQILPKKQNAGDPVVNQSHPVVDQSSINDTYVSKSQAQKEYKELLELFKTFDD